MPKVTRFILSYDLRNAKDGDHANFKTELESRKWDNCVGSEPSRKKLPETTMIGIFLDKDSAVKSVTSAASAAKVNIAKYVVCEIGALSLNSNEDCV